MNESDSNELLSAFVDGELQETGARPNGGCSLWKAGASQSMDAFPPNRRRRTQELVPCPVPIPSLRNVGAALSDDRCRSFSDRAHGARRCRAFFPDWQLPQTIASIAILGIHSLDDGGAQARSHCR